MKLMAILEGPEGCDYSIGCGTLIIFKPDDKSEDDFVNDIMENHEEDYGEIKQISFYRVEKVIASAVQKVIKWELEK